VHKLFNSHQRLWPAPDKSAKVCATGDGILIDHHFGDIAFIRQLVHGVEQRVFQDRTQAAGAGLARQRFLGDRVQRGRTDFQFAPSISSSLGTA
jgi:hypothetical protein